MTGEVRDELAALRLRKASKATANLATSTLITPVQCPNCLAPCFVTADSHDEAIACAGCDAVLVTAQVDGWVIAVLAPDGAL